MADPKDKDRMDSIQRLNMQDRAYFRAKPIAMDYIAPLEQQGFEKLDPIEMPKLLKSPDDDSIIDMMAAASTRPMRGTVFDPFLRTTPTYNERAVEQFIDTYNELHPVMPNTPMEMKGDVSRLQFAQSHDPAKGRRELLGTPLYRSNVPLGRDYTRGGPQPQIRAYARRPEEGRHQDLDTMNKRFPPSMDQAFESGQRRAAGGLTAAGPTGMIEGFEEVPAIQDQYNKMRSIYNNASPEQRQQMDAYVQRMRSPNPRGE